VESLESAELAREIVEAIAARKGADIVMLDLRDVSIIADYFVLGTGETARQIGAIVDEIRERLDGIARKPFHVEGVPDSGWMILDYSDVVVHIFAPAERQYYRLEQLWKHARLVVRMQ